MSRPEDRFHVVTGGPGSGKSTLIAALRDAGYSVVEESGRAIIKAQVASGGEALPWGDRIAYSRLMLARDVTAYQAAAGTTFFDRGVPDIQGYLSLIGEDPLPEVDAAVASCRYAPTVFVAPPWEAIFGQDSERKQDFAEACRTFDAMCAVYSEAGYTLATLPLSPVAARVDFILDRV